MAIIITEECINCGACEPECPNNAIYEGGAEWKLSDLLAHMTAQHHGKASDQHGRTGLGQTCPGEASSCF